MQNISVQGYELITSANKITRKMLSLEMNFSKSLNPTQNLLRGLSRRRVGPSLELFIPLLQLQD